MQQSISGNKHHRAPLRLSYIQTKVSQKMAHSHHKIISEIFAYISSVGLVQQPDKAQAELRLSLFIPDKAQAELRLSLFISEDDLNRV